MSQTHFSQTIEHLRLTGSNALGAFQAGRGTIQVTATLLLLGRGEQCQHGTIQLLVGGQTAGTRDAARHRRWRRAVTASTRRFADDGGRAERLAAHNAAYRRAWRRKRLDRRRTATGSGHHNHHTGILRLTLWRLGCRAGTGLLLAIDRRTRIDNGDGAARHTGTTAQHYRGG
ncbi:hypothetical protein D3C87_1631140 [compost metagenome]